MKYHNSKTANKYKEVIDRLSKKKKKKKKKIL